MARKENRRSLKKKSEGRQTPRDIEVRGTLLELPKKPRKAVRERTSQEMRADDTAPVAWGRSLADLPKWKPMFEADLFDMNRGKVGRPYEFSDSMIYWIMVLLAATGCSYRFISGFLGRILELFGLKAPSRTRLLERSIELSAELMKKNLDDAPSEFGEGFLAVHVCSNILGRVRRVGIDSSGLNLSSVLGWRRKKWKDGPKDKGWLKLHALCDVDSGEIIAYAITRESVGDAPVLKILVEMAAASGHKMGRIYADGAYSSDANWIYLSRDNDYEFITSFKSNTTPTCNGCTARGKAATLWCNTQYSEWVEITGYGTRWKSECVFSDSKRIFGETISARTDAGAVAEIFRRLEAFNAYKGERANILQITGNGIMLV